jgi:hypothetical protein
MLGYGCEISTQVGPIETGPTFWKTAKIGKMVGSRSAPIGTPPQPKFPPINQQVKADQ